MYHSRLAKCITAVGHIVSVFFVMKPHRDGISDLVVNMNLENDISRVSCQKIIDTEIEYRNTLFMAYYWLKRYVIDVLRY